VVFFSSKLNLELQVLNIFGLYLGNNKFFGKTLSESILKYGFSLVKGDINFTLGTNKIWGSTAQMDNLVEFIIPTLEYVGLLNLQPPKLMPTWRNMGIFGHNISKRLDNFIIYQSLLVINIRVQQWVSMGGDSDHSTILFELAPSSPKSLVFKLNSSCLEYPSFISLLK
jgi:hypothetical protein